MPINTEQSGGARTTATAEAEGRLMSSLLKRKKRKKNSRLKKIIKDGQGGHGKHKY